MPIFLDRVQQQAAMMIPHLQLGLQGIKRLHPDLRAACEFQNVLVIHPRVDAPPTGRLTNDSPETDLKRFRTFAMTISCTIRDEGIDLSTYFDSNVVNTTTMQRVLVQLEYVLNNLAMEDENMTLDIAAQINPDDVRQIQTWNHHLPQRIDACVHELFHRTALAYPKAPAVCAWDGELSYSQLDDLSSRLAKLLVTAGVAPETYVAFCFEKSLLAVVALLAIMKAGGICTPLDPGHPKARHTTLFKATNASVLVVSEMHASLFEDAATKIVVTSPMLSGLELSDFPVCRGVEPSNAVYVIVSNHPV